MMTLDQLRAVPGTSLKAHHVAEYLGMNQQAIRYMARAHPEMLGFPVACYRNEGSVTWHCLIPKDAFIAWATGQACGKEAAT